MGNKVVRNLNVQQGQNILIRDATSSFGKAAINLAADTGAVVTAKTRSEAKSYTFTGLGVFEAVLETPSPGECLRESHNFVRQTPCSQVFG